MTELYLRDGLVGRTYITERGHKVSLIRVRSDTNEPVVKVMLTGHELVLPADYVVVPDSDVIMVDDKPTARSILSRIVYRLVQESGLSPDGLADIIPISADQIDADLKILMGDLDGSGQIPSPYAAATSPQMG